MAALLLTSTPRPIGDAPEYLANARKLAQGQWPSFSKPEAAALDPGIKWVNVRGDRVETVHFWFYSLVAVPMIWAGGRLGYSAEWAFAATNTLIFAAVAALLLRRVAPIPSLLVLLSPIIWWIDKPHPEVFTFALIAAAMVTVLDRPAVALIAVALASTQNPPIAALVPLILLLFPASRGRLMWIILAVWLAALHPLYYLWKIGQTTALINGDIRIPPLMRFVAVLWDFNIGLVANAPVLVAALLMTLIAARRQLAQRWRPVLLAVSAALWFLFSFTQAVNINHGGTPSMSRYALWLVPLTLVWMPERGKTIDAGRQRVLFGLTAASVAWSVAFFHPRLPEGHLRPTRLASFQWTRFPAWQNPVPEIFAERLRGRDAVNELAATAGCEKVLIQAGVWPHPCPAQTTPAVCAQPDVWCYGNRTSGGYEYVQVPRRGGYRLGWPPQRGR